MTTANRIVSLIEIAGKAIKVLFLNKIHTLPIESFNRTMYDSLIIKLVLETEALTPMAEVAGDYKDSPFIQKQGQKDLRIGPILCLRYVANHHWHKLKSICTTSVPEHLLDIR